MPMFLDFPVRPLTTSLLLCGLLQFSIAPRAYAEAVVHDDDQTKAPVKPAIESKEKDKVKSKNETAQSQKVEVKGNREYDARRFDTASKIVVTQEEIARYGDTEITDVLKRLPSVSIVGGAIRMRGLGSGYTQVLLNGEPSPPGFSIESLAPDLIERIEIVRSASAEFSTQAVAGTINIILKKSVQLTQYIAKLGYVQRGDQPSGLFSSLQISDKVGTFSYSLPINLYQGHTRNADNLSLTRSFGANASTIQLRQTNSADNNHNHSFSSAPRAIWTLENEDVLSLNSFISVNGSDNRSSTQTSSLIGPIYPFVFERYNTQNTSENFSNSAQLVHKLGDSAKLELRFGTHYWHSKSNGQTYGLDGVEQPFFVRRVYTENYNRGWSSSGKYNAPFIEDHVISMGWEAASRWQSSDNLSLGTTAINLQVQAIDQREDVAFKVQRKAAYIQDEWSFDKQLSFYFGARWERIDLDGAGTGLNAVQNASSVLSPILQSLYKVPDHPNQQWRLAFSRTYKAVNSWDLVHRHYYSTNNSPTAPDSLPNPNLRPELATGLDLSYEYFLDGGGVFSANVFLRKINGITRNLLVYQDQLWALIPSNVGHATTKGLELEAKFPLRLWIESAPAIDLRANLGFNHSSLDSVPGPNNRLDAQVPFRGNLGIDYKMAALPVSLGASYAMQSAGLVRQSATQWNYGIATRSLEAYALWKIDANSNLRISSSNLLHQTPYSRSLYHDENGGISRDNFGIARNTVRLNYERRF